jgi:hypothetical protein
MKNPPVVDDRDVDRMINFIFGSSINTNITAEERADAAYHVALGVAKVQGGSASFAEAFAKRVRDRALWITAPTGRAEDMPD